jgi:hypothetical protein
MRLRNLIGGFLGLWLAGCGCDSNSGDEASSQSGKQGDGASGGTGGTGGAGGGDDMSGGAGGMSQGGSNAGGTGGAGGENIYLPGSVTRRITTGLHSCVLRDTGKVRCWGRGSFGQLGYGNKDMIGDDETPASAGDIDVGGTVTQLAAGSNHTCVLLDTNAVRCWGHGYYGSLGYGNLDTIGDDETPASAGDVIYE